MSVCDRSEGDAKSTEAVNVLTRCRIIDSSTIAVVSNLSWAAVHDFNFINYSALYRGADKSLARPTSRCILFDGENISFDASLVLYI